MWFTFRLFFINWNVHKSWRLANYLSCLWRAFHFQLRYFLQKLYLEPGQSLQAVSNKTPLTSFKRYSFQKKISRFPTQSQSKRKHHPCSHYPQQSHLWMMYNDTWYKNKNNHHKTFCLSHVFVWKTLEVNLCIYRYINISII